MLVKFDGDHDTCDYIDDNDDDSYAGNNDAGHNSHYDANGDDNDDVGIDLANEDGNERMMLMDES